VKLSYRRRAAARPEGGVTDATESIDLTGGTLFKIVSLLAGSTGLGTFLSFFLTFVLRDLPASREDNLVRERCLRVQIAAVAMQADSAEARREGLRLLLALGALSDPGGRLDSLLSSPSPLPRWESAAALDAACAPRERSTASLREASSGDESTSNRSEEAPSSGRQSEGGVPGR
jgi:hypothetical protein